jgi:hypothetical protein
MPWLEKGRGGEDKKYKTLYRQEENKKKSFLGV